ncbi:MAG: superoxide dismutase family protein [Bdellovibrionaceae bacterium]|nr:superoxide dismutase family protein [Pseudobdellovibrionaceae bacterium]
MKSRNIRLMKGLLIALGLGLGLGLTACASSPPPETKMGSADLKPRSGSNASGHVHFHQLDKRVHVAFEVKGLAANSKHGFHLHEKGDCSAIDAMSAGGHYNPGGHQHGSLVSANRHAGDFGNIQANAQGVAKGELYLDNMHVRQLKGLSVIVHEKEDDEKSQPAGNAGSRIACGVIQ